LVIESGAGGHAGETEAHGDGPGFGDDDIVGLEEAFPARIKRIGGDRVSARAGHRFWWRGENARPVALRQRLGKRGHDFADFHIGDDLAAEMNAVVRETDELVHVEPGGKSAAVQVAQDCANSHDAVAAFDEGADVLVEECTFIHANVVGVLLVDDRLIHEHRGERQVRGIDEGTD
jgi:hypothetical protein